MSTYGSPGRRVAIVAGVRTPFARAGTTLRSLSAIELGKRCVAELLQRTEVDTSLVEAIVYGTVVPSVVAPNIAREVSLMPMLPKGVQSFTVSRACASANQAITDGADQIALGHADVIIAGGAESLSNVPILHSRGMSDALVAASKARTFGGRVRALARVRPRDLVPITPAIAEPTTGESMGESAEKMAKINHVPREEQDQFALRSHRLAAAGTQDGRLTAEIAPLFVPPAFDAMTIDNGVRTDSTIEALAALKPVFDRKYGTVTAGNSSPLTDGASAVLLMSEERAKILGYTPLAYIRSYSYAALDPGEQLLMGPVLAAPVALQRAGLTLNQIDLIEMHEAFAAQVLCNLKGFVSQEWATRAGFSKPVGEVDRAKLNVMGGSISIGHPFGATGGRILMTLCNELARRGGQFGLMTVCAAGGMGHAMVIERVMPALSIQRVDGVAVVTIDLPGEPVNKVTAGLRAEFSDVFAAIVADTTLRAIVLISGKSDTWLAGADIDEFLTLQTAADAEALSRSGQALLASLEGLKLPVVAAIHGACLGAGLECALACRYRVATDHPKTVLALPEVQLGLVPGAGGTQRLPRLIGLQRALDLILTGRNVRAKKAYQMGLVDELVHPAILLDIAIDRARKLADGKLSVNHAPKGRGATGVLLEDNPIGRSIVFRKAREGVLAKTHGHYPAPMAAIGAVQVGYDRGAEAGFREESRVFGEMAVSDVAKQLIFLFFATSALKKDPGVDAPVPVPSPVDTLGIVGAGFMGAGIASVAVQQGTPVRLKDTDVARVGKGIGAVSEVLRERLAKKQITRLQYDDLLSLAGGTTNYSGFGRANLVVEAVFEDLTLKHRVLREVESALLPDAIYASNTSTIPIGRIAEASARPNRVLGMHFFSPVHKMPLLEVITTAATDKDATVTAVAYGKKLGKTVIVVNDAPGFYTTRTLSAYMNEAGRLLDEGASIEAIDKALLDFGFPVGPITLLDEVGIDVGGKVGQTLFEAFGARMLPSESLRRVVESGRTGRKGRQGFYLYDEQGKKNSVDASVYGLLPHGAVRREIDPEEIQQRCVLAMVNEAVRCLEEGVLRSARDGDVGAVFGIGFPPFRGGPFRYVDSVGAAEIVGELEQLNGRFPGRFAPAELLVHHARARRRFYAAHGPPLP